MMYQPLNAKVEAPNYDFSLTAFDDFQPEKKLADLEAKYGKGEPLGKQAGFQTYRFKVSQLRYKYSVLVQEKNGVINDFFARMPNYFLHDGFFQSLVKRLGKQTSYKRVGEEAFYIWNVNGQTHIYSAACTITCFPIFYSVEPTEPKGPSILKQMTTASRGK